KENWRAHGRPPETGQRLRVNACSTAIAIQYADGRAWLTFRCITTENGANEARTAESQGPRTQPQGSEHAHTQLREHGTGSEDAGYPLAYRREIYVLGARCDLFGRPGAGRKLPATCRTL